jgi:glycosyltransferase involved in cell wall biosynthesis
LLPSYIEGFGMGVLEQLAAGIPTVAYDVPGPREMLRLFATLMMTPRGDVAAASRRLIELLNSSEDQYARLSRESRQIASRFRWREIAAEMLQIYSRLGAGQSGPRPAEVSRPMTG